MKAKVPSWPTEEVLLSFKNRTLKSSLKKELTNIEKYQEYIAYLLELGYDLAINPDNNVSRSPGFESFLGIFG